MKDQTNSPAIDAGSPRAEKPVPVSRRRFLGKVGGATTALAAAGTGLPALLAKNRRSARQVLAQDLIPHAAGTFGVASPSNPVSGRQRTDGAFNYRMDMATMELEMPIPSHASNGDENLYPTRIGNFSKGLPHNSLGEVETSAYSALLQAVTSGSPTDFDAIPLGGTVKLTNPQSGLAYDLEGTDVYQMSEPPAPPVASAIRGAEMVEVYWMALARDIPFYQYGQEPTTQAAIAELSRISDFQGPKHNGHVTAQTLFRTGNYGDTVGPWMSQFLLQPFDFGALSMTQQYNTYTAGIDYMTDFGTWLDIQNGIAATQTNSSAGARYLHDGRGMAAWVHIDVLFQAYFTGMQWLITNKTAFNEGNPYNSSANQVGFGTFGMPHIDSLMCEVGTRALQAQWYQKWFVHRAERPEAFGGLVQNVKTGAANYPLDTNVLQSHAAAGINTRYGSWLLPQAFPEGCPTHPSYGSGHATVAGACVTILKAFFNTSAVVPNPVYSPDGVTLVPYSGSDASQMTIEVELNKLAMNVSQGRNIAGVHWRSDALRANLLGEAVAIGLLRDQRKRYNESFPGFTFRTFGGKTITV